jgi:hypothetical protein
MALHVKQSTAVVLSFGPFVDKTDGVTPEIGLVTALDHVSTGILLSKNGGALTIRHASVTASTYDSYGNYRVTLDTTDVNTLGTLRMQFIETATCLPVWLDLMVMPANIWDSLYGADFLQVDQAQWLGQAVAAVDTNGYPKVTVKDGTGQGEILTTSGKVDGVILSDTVTTYTGNTPQTGDSYARIGATGSGLSTLATQASVNTIDDFLDTEVLAIKTVTDALPNAGALTTIQADLDDLQTRLPAALTGAGNMKADALLLNGATPNNLAATAIVSSGAITTSGGKVSGVILADTVTTYTGNTLQTGDAYARIGATGSGLSTLATQASVNTIDDFLDTEIADIKTKTDLIPAAPAAVGSAMTLTSGERTSIADATRARQLTEGYAADGVAPTLEQAVFMVMQGILEFGIAGTVLTTKKLDKSTSAMTHTLDDALAPTSRTRAT